jgi:hypothetical protein
LFFLLYFFGVLFLCFCLLFVLRCPLISVPSTSCFHSVCTFSSSSRKPYCDQKQLHTARWCLDVSSAICCVFRMIEAYRFMVKISVYSDVTPYVLVVAWTAVPDERPAISSILMNREQEVVTNGVSKPLCCSQPRISLLSHCHGPRLPVLNLNTFCCFVWAWNLVAHIEGGM